MNFYDDIIASNSWVKVELVDKGWSSDKKYHIQTKDRQDLLLRISDISQYDIKKEEYESMKLVANRKILMSYPLDFGVCNNNKLVYLLLTWIEGEDAESAVKRMNPKDQYKYGLKAGEYLRQIHSLPAPTNHSNWFSRFNHKIDRNIKNYESCGVSIAETDLFINFVNNNRELLRDRPQTFQHGDYHTGNMIISQQGQLGIIDFNRWDYGDPWEEFNRIVWSVRTSESFASGYINGYFENSVPNLFFRLMALYIASNQLASIPWAIKFGKSEVVVMIEISRAVLDWYDGFKEFVPKWYKRY